jgi:hypothetical protein
VHACLSAESVKFTVVYGVSDNADSWWSNAHAAHLNYVPKDNASHYRTEIEALIASGKSVRRYALQGGKRAEYGLAIALDETTNP